MNISLHQKVALVTGASRDIGKYTALNLAAAGAYVCVNYKHNKAAADDVVNAIIQNGGRAVAVYADVTKADEVEQLIQTCLSNFGTEIHYLVNIAGGLLARKQVHEMDASFWNEVMTLNLSSVFTMCKAVLPYMKSGAAIVNLSSQAGFDGGGFGAIAYATAKGAIATFTRGLAKELGPSGIRVNAVAPGMINTTFHDTFTSPEVRKAVAGMAPLRREGEAQDVADLITYLLSDKAAYITGENVAINGGTYFH